MPIVRLALVGALVTSFAACSSSNNDTTNQDNGDQQQTGGDDQLPGGDPVSGGDELTPGDDAGDTTPGDTFDPTRPMTLTELCQLRVRSSIDLSLQCASDFDAASEVTLETGCLPSAQQYVWAKALLDSADNERISIDWAKARQCNAQARALRSENKPLALLDSDDWKTLTSASGVCTTFYTALVDTTGTCTYAWDCKNATDACRQPPPYGSAPFTCTPRGVADAPCTNYGSDQCAPGFQCNGSTCQLSGNACTTSDDCPPGSGACQNGVCSTAGTAVIGATCASNLECAGSCSVCSSGRCRVRGDYGAACTSASDCATDLGCYGNVCGKLPLGGDCDRNGSACAAGSCDWPVDCSTFADADSCATAAPYCAFDGTCGWTTTGQCMEYPTTGACGPTYHTQRCAVGYNCVGSDPGDHSGGTCQASAAVGAACDDTLTTAPSCGGFARCVDNVCVSNTCSTDADCNSGQRCVDGQCADAPDADCTSGSPCGFGEFCLTPDVACPQYIDAATCNANPDCTFDDGGSTCGVSADAHTRCVPLRQPGETVAGACVTQIGPGVSTAPLGSSSSCSYVAPFNCYDDGTTPPTCMAPPRSCLNYGTADLIPVTFLFGLVRIVRRKRKQATN